MMRARLVLIVAVFGLLPGLATAQGDRAEVLVGLARVKRDAGDEAASRRYFEEARRIQPLKPGELVEYFWVVAGQAPQTAVTVGRELLRLAPADDAIRDRTILAAAAAGDEGVVIELAAEGERLAAGTARWPRRLGESYLRTGRADEAAAAYGRAVAAADAAAQDQVGLALALEARRRAFGKSPATEAAAAEVAAWLRDNPADREMRELLIDLWSRTGHPGRALELVGPLQTGGDRDRWTRREAELARAAGDRVRAIARLQDLSARGRAAGTDRWNLAELLVETRQFDRARAALAALPVAPTACDGRLLQLMDRLPDPAATDLMVEALRARDCTAAPRWLVRGVERTVALGRHRDALDIIRALPAAEANRDVMRLREGQLQLWTGDAPSAIAILEPLVVRLPDDLTARQTLVDAYRATGRSSDAVLPQSRASEAAAPLPAVSPSAPTPQSAVALIDATPATLALARQAETLPVMDDLTRVGELAAAERWTDAIVAVDEVLARDGRSSAALRLRAEVLSWSGRHAEAIDAYDVYLRVMPGDLQARRQKARVAGWSGRAAEAARLYGLLRSEFPANAAVAAEAEAKEAFLAGRWQAASEAYRRWLQLEPDTTEARFELAESLRASGEPESSDEVLAALAVDTGHRLAVAARERAAFQSRPSFAVIDEQRATNGYGGQPLITLRQTGGQLSAGLGMSGRTRLTASGGRLHAASAGGDRNGYRIGMSSSTRISSSVRLDTALGWWSLDTAGDAWSEVKLLTAWRPADLWTVMGGVDREIVTENLVTIDSRLASSGVFIGGERVSRSASLTGRASWQNLSDGNARRRITFSASRSLAERIPGLRAMTWIEGLSYRNKALGYFSPSHFLRADIGVEYTHSFRTPRFRGDRQSGITGSYLIGTDNRGATYQHPSMRLGLEWARGIGLDFSAGAIRSRDYQEASFSIALRVSGLGNRQ